MSRILVIDDDRAICRSLELQLGSRGHVVSSATSAEAGLRRAAETSPEIVFLDLRLPDLSGLRVLERLRGLAPAPAVIMITGEQDMKATIEATRLGALDYIRKPLDREEILAAATRAEQAKVMSTQSAECIPLGDVAGEPREIVGRERGIIAVIQQIGMLSQSSINVLIRGESGTGKELVARAIHEASRPAHPFIAINCSSVVENLWESEIFGHEKGAFTGAEARKLGKLELAGEGSVFLDEIGDMPLAQQAKLLRALQEREFERVGGTEAVPLRARILAATHRDLEEMVSRSAFRADLLHRLEVARIAIPPLRERKGDILLLVEHLVAKLRRVLGRDIHAISRPALDTLMAHEWPGNVRELENVLMRSLARCRGEVLEEVEMLEEQGEPRGSGRARFGSSGPIETLREMECEHVRRALEHHGWNITHTARTLDISPTTLRKKIADYGLRADPSEGPEKSG